jgi:hypothetical protein
MTAGPEAALNAVLESKTEAAIRTEMERYEQISLAIFVLARRTIDSSTDAFSSPGRGTGRGGFASIRHQYHDQPVLARLW